MAVAKRGVGSAIMSALLVSLIVGTMVAFPAWMHHDIRVDSPVFASAAQAQAWVETFEHGEGARCLPWAIDNDVIDQGGYEGGWFVQFRCNTPRALVRVAMGYAIPAAMVLLLAFVLTPRREHTKRKKK